MTQDPRLQTTNPYLYSGNSPMMYVDPDGEFFWLIPVLVGAAIGGYSGYKIGEANGAKGWQMFSYIMSGAAIGGLSGGAAMGVSALGAGSALAGLTAGAVGGAGFAGLSTNWDANAMLKGMAFGAISGYVGGAFSGAIGGGWGALTGGVTSNATSQLLYTGNIDLGQMAMAGATSIGLYHGLSYASWKWGGGKGHFKELSYRQFSKMNTIAQRSRFWKREYVAVMNPDTGGARIVKGTKFGGEYSFKKGEAWAAHTHWARPGVDWLETPNGNGGFDYSRYNSAQSIPNGSQVITTVDGYHSSMDLPAVGNSYVIGRTSSSFALTGSSTYIPLSRDPFIRFMPYIPYIAR